MCFIRNHDYEFEHPSAPATRTIIVVFWQYSAKKRTVRLTSDCSIQKNVTLEKEPIPGHFFVMMIQSN